MPEQPKAGLFAGEVTKAAPANNAFTLKARGYQWMEWAIPSDLPVFYVRTSFLYPFDMQDEMDVSGSLDSASMVLLPLEEHSMSISLLDGSMATILEAHDQLQQEEYNMSISLLDGVLATILEAHDQLQQEEHNMSISLLDGVLDTLLIITNIGPETIYTSGTLDSGTLQ